MKFRVYRLSGHDGLPNSPRWREPGAIVDPIVGVISGSSTVIVIKASILVVLGSTTAILVNGPRPVAGR